MIFEKKNKKRIALLTSGGDAPGMNASIRSVVRAAVYNGLDVFGVYRGFAGIIDGEMKQLNARSVSNIITEGGTILKTSRCPGFMTREGQKKAVAQLKKHKIDCLIVIGGNGSFHGAQALGSVWGIDVIGIPGTIDNDLNGTDYTLGADTAVNTALQAIDKIRDTVHSMERIFIVEVMGRHEGFIAIRCGLTGGAEDIVVPEIEYDINSMCDDIRKGREKGKMNWIIVVAEGVTTAEDFAEKIRGNTGFEVRSITLGHIQRGGSPTAMDRLLGLRFGAAAVDAFLKGEKGKMVGVEADEIVLTSFELACEKCEKKMNLDRELLKLTRMLAI